MKKTLITILLLSFSPLFISNAFAGMGACHDGQGNVTKLELRANHSYFKNTPNCVYYEIWKDGITPSDYDRIRTVIRTVPEYYAKWNGNEPVEMTQAEKETTPEWIAQQAEQAKQAEFDAEITGSGLKGITLEQINNKIDAISNLNQAKNFLKKLVRYLYANRVVE